MSLKSKILKALEDGPKSGKQLRAQLGGEPKKLAKQLKGLVQSGKVCQRSGRFALAGVHAQQDLIEGSLVKLGRRFAFVLPADGSEEIFIPGKALLGALPKDIVQVALFPHPRVPGTREGEIVAVKTPHESLTGTVAEQDGKLVLVPDCAPDLELTIRRSADGGAKGGEKVAAQILDRGKSYADHRVGIVQRFGSASSARQCAKAILFAEGIEKSFPDAVKTEAKAAANAKIPKDEIKSRADFREEFIFTIDSESTKDIDDAISARRTDAGYQLGVHIADVSYYVKAKTPLDAEAYARGTSIYYANSVVPMLPRSLSNGACSLNPGEDRLAFSCLMELDKDGRLQSYRFVKSLINSRVKGVYEEINTLFEGGKEPALLEKYAPVQGSLALMREIYEKLAALRAARGSLEIESDEPDIRVDAEGRCVDIALRTRGLAECMIEEFMLLANTSAARLARENELPFVYRVHGRPSPDKAAQLNTVLAALGVETGFKAEIPTQAELGAILDKTRGTPLQIPVHTAVLRSMAKAVYEPEAKGHYGLALEDYAHFTSPIRRYPDLVVHRILGSFVQGDSKEQIAGRYTKFVKAASEQSSERELLAQRIERDCDDCYKAEYMHQFIGQEFEGVITAATSFGIYVGLPNTVEGLVHITRLPGGRLELQNGIALANAVTGQRYRVGDAIRVRLAAADVSRGQIDFDLAE